MSPCWTPAYPQSVHVGYPNVGYQVEVYDPTSSRAMQLVSSGQLTSIGSLAATTTGRISTKPTAATRADLRTFGQRVGHPIYWAGARPGYTYELSSTSNGSVFIRYLPVGTKVGDPRATFLTVATYPFPGAFAATTRAATAAGSAATIKLAHGGIGVVDGSYPKSIHIAYPGVSYQIEVYDPSPSTGRKLVASGAISPVP